MDDIPSEAEVTRLMQDFKQALKARPYQTPLCRAHRQLRSRMSVQHFQRSQSQARKVQQLLPPGHCTLLNINVLRVIADSDCRPRLRIPPTLLSTPTGAVLLSNKVKDRVEIRIFSQLQSAFQAFQKACDGPQRPDFPQFVYRSETQPSDFHHHMDSVKAVWSKHDPSQQLQAFIQPRYKTPSLLRAHWKQNQPLVCYSLYEGQRKPRLPALLSRSASVAPGVQPDSASLTVVRIKHAPNLELAMDTIARILRPQLEKGATVSELVCDFAQDQAARWVFLRCQGLAFHPARQRLATTISPQHPINSSFLLYPEVVQTKEVGQRLHWHSKLHAIAAQNRLSWSSFLRTGNESSQLPVESKREDEQLQTQACPHRSRLVEEVISREVDQMDRLLCRSRASRTQNAEKLNFVEKYGGVRFWESAICAMLPGFYRQDDIVNFVLEGMSHDQLLLIARSILRILQGDYNFYYKETLRKVHFHYLITSKHFQVFLQIIAEVLTSICSSEHTEAILQRFKEFEPFICRQS